jgi:hypothetical protein
MHQDRKYFFQLDKPAFDFLDYVKPVYRINRDNIEYRRSEKFSLWMGRERKQIAENESADFKNEGCKVPL